MDDNPWTGLMIICLIVIVIIVICCSPASAAECRLMGKPEPKPWEPDPEDVAYISRTIWGECRGCCEEEQREQVWCILNRVDDPRFPGTIAEVVLVPYQFQGYSANNPVEPFAELAREILCLWRAGYREIPTDMCWCEGRNGHQIFRNSWIVTEETEFYPGRK